MRPNKVRLSLSSSPDPESNWAKPQLTRPESFFMSCLIGVYSVCLWKYDISDNFFALWTDMKLNLYNNS